MIWTPDYTEQKVAMVFDEYGSPCMGNMRRPGVTDSDPDNFRNLISTGNYATDLLKSNEAVISLRYGDGTAKNTRGGATMSVQKGGLGRAFYYDYFYERFFGASDDHIYVPCFNWGGEEKTNLATKIWGPVDSWWYSTSRRNNVIGHEMYRSFWNHTVVTKNNRMVQPIWGWRNDRDDAIVTIGAHISYYTRHADWVFRNCGIATVLINSYRYNYVEMVDAYHGTDTSFFGGRLYCPLGYGLNKKIMTQPTEYGTAGTPIEREYVHGNMTESFIMFQVRVPPRSFYYTFPGDNYDSCTCLFQPGLRVTCSASDLPSSTYVTLVDSFLAFRKA